jgi:hypothetical protein
MDDRRSEPGQRPGSREPGAKRLRVAAIAGLVHCAMQFLVYVIAFAVGPDGATAERGGVSLYGIAEVLTFPVVWFAERSALQLPALGIVYLLANSAVWAAAAYALLRLLGWPRRRSGPPP